MGLLMHHGMGLTMALKAPQHAPTHAPSWQYVENLNLNLNHNGTGTGTGTFFSYAAEFRQLPAPQLHNKAACSRTLGTLRYRLTHSSLPRTAPLKLVTQLQTARAVRIDRGMGTYRIYALTEPDDEATKRYVGQTADHLTPRLAGHLRLSGKRSGRADWIRSVVERGTKPGIVLLEEIRGTRRDAYARETQWIQRLRAEGHQLLNVP